MNRTDYSDCHGAFLTILAVSRRARRLCYAVPTNPIAAAVDDFNPEKIAECEFREGRLEIMTRDQDGKWIKMPKDR